jgi:hypothetical protein
MNSVAASAEPIAQADRSALLVLAAGAVITWLGDFLFWHALPGVSLGIFVMTLAAPLVAVRRSPRAWLLAALLLVSCGQTAVEVSLSNVLVLVGLLITLMGESLFAFLPRAEARLTAAAISVLAAPLRWLSFARAILASPLSTSAATMVGGDNVARALRIVIPGLALCGIFAAVLSAGNALLKSFVTQFADQLIHWLLNFDFSPGRVALWIGYATLTLGLLWPRIVRLAAVSADEGIARWSRAHPREALWQSAFALVILNVLFLSANTIDVLYLWRNAVLPAEVSASEYLHSGIWSLIVAVLLSAVVLAGIFQQQAEVSGSRFLKSLGLVWVLQNLVLIAGVVLRLKLYVDAYQLTEKRVYVGCFLALVMTGFLLLAWSIERAKGLRWLFSWNLLATCALFFLLQFPDVSGAVARYNVARWRHEPGRVLDLDYLVDLGPNAWPALVEISHDSHQPSVAAEAAHRVAALAVTEAADRVATLALEQAAAHAHQDWRSWQWRRERGVAAILQNAAR